MSDSVISGSVGTSELTTPRLILRPLEIADAPAIQALFPQWEVVRFLDAVVPWPYPPDGAARYIGELALPDMLLGEAWHWSIRPKTAPETLIGAITVRLKEGDNRGFWLDPSWQGQGLMTEACEVVTDFWFRDLEQPLLRVVKAAANRRSRRISERSFMRVIDVMEREFVGGRMLAEEWEITREEWFRRSR